MDDVRSSLGRHLDGERSPLDSVLPPGVDGAGREGAVRISENVIAAIVRKYVLEVPGVMRFASAGFVDGLAEIIKGRSHDNRILVGLEGQTVTIAVSIVLRFGVSIREVAERVQQAVRERVEELTGLVVTRIDVTVQDIEEQTAGSDRVVSRREDV